MFEKFLNELKKIDGMKISIPIEIDEEGYSDRECPNEECMFQFKVYEEDWNEKFKDEAIYCPMCGKESTSDTFWTTEQVKNFERQGAAYLESKIHKAMKKGARDFNRRQPKGGFITMSISVQGHIPEKIIMPIPAKDIFEQKIQCKNCDSRFSVIGSAFFCPCCGHNSAERTFKNTINKIEDSIKNIHKIRIALNEVSKDQSANTCQSLIEKGLLDCVVAFQRFCDVMYPKHKNALPKVPFNAFQKLDVGGRLWKELLKESYIDWLSEHEFKRLNILFQRRHLLQHTEGIVDLKYLEKSLDQKYKEGQRIVVKEKDVIELVGYIKTMTNKIRKRIVK